MKFAIAGFAILGLVAFSGMNVLAQQDSQPAPEPIQPSAPDISEVDSDEEFDVNVDWDADGDGEQIRVVIRESLRNLDDLDGLGKTIEKALESALEGMDGAMQEIERALDDAEFDKIEEEIEAALNDIPKDSLKVHVDGLEDLAEIIEEVFEAIGEWFENSFEGAFEDAFEGIGESFEELFGSLEERYEAHEAKKAGGKTSATEDAPIATETEEQQ